MYEGVVKNNYLYNGKELLDENADLGWLDYGFRNYDPQIGRFPQLDPLSWEYPYYTPYQFAGNDPIANVDLDGLEPWNVVSKIKSVLKEGGEHVVSGVRKSGLNIGKWTVSWFKDGVAFSHVFHSTGFLTQRFASATIHLLSSASNIATSVPFKMRGDLANSFKIPNQQQQAINAYNAASSLLNEAIDKGWRRAETVNPDDQGLSGWQSWEVNDITGDKRIKGLVQAITPVYPEAAAIPFPKLGKLFSWLRSIKFGVGAAKTSTTVLEGAVKSNYGRFVSKIPANSKSSASFQILDDGNYLFQATSPGKVPGSSAIYQKWVNPQGETYKMIKTTVAPDGSIIHVKPKF